MCIYTEIQDDVEQRDYWFNMVLPNAKDEVMNIFRDKKKLAIHHWVNTLVVILFVLQRIIKELVKSINNQGDLRCLIRHISIQFNISKSHNLNCHCWSGKISRQWIDIGV